MRIKLASSLSAEREVMLHGKYSKRRNGNARAAFLFLMLAENDVTQNNVECVALLILCAAVFIHISLLAL